MPRKKKDLPIYEPATRAKEPGFELLVDGKSFHLGYSRITSFLECPRKYRYSYIDKHPGKVSDVMRVGTVYHAVVEDLLNFRLKKQNLYPLEKALIHAKAVAEHEELTPSQTSRVVSGVEFYHHAVYPFHEPLAVEEEFSIVRGGVTLTGKIDLIQTDGSIVDHKFSFDTWAEERSKYGIQPAIYQWAGMDWVKPKYNIDFAGFAYNIVRLFPTQVCQVIEIPPMTQSESDWWEDQVHDVAKAILAGNFPANSKDTTCSYCWHKTICQPTIYNVKTKKMTIYENEEE